MSSQASPFWGSVSERCYATRRRGQSLPCAREAFCYRQLGACKVLALSFRLSLREIHIPPQLRSNFREATRTTHPSRLRLSPPFPHKGRLMDAGPYNSSFPHSFIPSFHHSSFRARAGALRPYRVLDFARVIKGCFRTPIFVVYIAQKTRRERPELLECRFTYNGGKMRYNGGARGGRARDRFPREEAR